jgi:hypothetical protein
LTGFNQQSVVKTMENTGKYRPVNAEMLKSRNTAKSIPFPYLPDTLL